MHNFLICKLGCIVQKQVHLCMCPYSTWIRTWPALSPVKWIFLHRWWCRDLSKAISRIIAIPDLCCLAKYGEGLWLWQASASPGKCAHKECLKTVETVCFLYLNSFIHLFIQQAWVKGLFCVSMFQVLEIRYSICPAKH